MMLELVVAGVTTVGGSAAYVALSTWNLNRKMPEQSAYLSHDQAQGYQAHNPSEPGPRPGYLEAVQMKDGVYRVPPSYLGPK